MRRQAGVFVAAIFYYSGLVALSRWLMRRGGRRLIVLNYHRASGGDLLRHMDYLSRHYRMLHLEDALEELFAPATQKTAQVDQRTPLVLTFDDGYYDNYTHAFLFAQKLQVPVTIFLVPGYVESGDYFWWREGQRLVHRATVDEVTLEDQVYRLSHPAERVALAKVIDSRLRYSHSVAERNSSLAELRRLLQVPASVTPDEEAKRPLSWSEVDEMAQSGLVSFGGHTTHHPVLAYLSDAEEVRNEVSECRQILQERLKQRIRTFAYPVGRKEHIGADAIEAVKEAGFDWALTTIHGVNTPDSNPYLLGRVLGDVSRHWLVMAAEVSGIWHFFSPLWKAIAGKGEDV